MRLPVAFKLHKWDVVVVVSVANTYEEPFTLAGNENVLLFVNGDSILGKDGNGAIIIYFSNTHKGLWEVGTKVGM